ncbi:MAG: hypothetical protein ACJ764_03070 [Solirubrobacteraceae bacterium]
MNDGAVKALTRVRAAIGAGAWLAPRLSGRLFGLDPEANPQLPYLGRLFGVRDAALAVGLGSSNGTQRAQWLQLGLACDLADAMAGVLAGRRGQLPPRSAVLVTGTALFAAGLGVAALRAEQPEAS